jgi:hypothetical protein
MGVVVRHPEIYEPVFRAVFGRFGIPAHFYFDQKLDEHAVARFLLPPGRTYNQAVAELSPYERVQQPYPQGRAAMQRLIRVAMDDERTLYVFVNNRLEGNAIQTIEETTAALE